MNWYLNAPLTLFRNEVNARWPSRDKTSDGTIGDAAHQSSTSDHNPDPDGSVDAWDCDVDGIDVWTVIKAALAHPSIQYVIYNRRITSRSWGLGVWRTYTGPNPHTKHIHFSTRDSHENSRQTWLGVDEVNATQEKTLNRIDRRVYEWRIKDEQWQASVTAILEDTRRIVNSDLEVNNAILFQLERIKELLAGMSVSIDNDALARAIVRAFLANGE